MRKPSGVLRTRPESPSGVVSSKRGKSSSSMFQETSMKISWRMSTCMELWLRNPTPAIWDGWNPIWLVVEPYPSEKSWSESQLGWLFHSQYDGKVIQIPWFQSPPSPAINNGITSVFNWLCDEKITSRPCEGCASRSWEASHRWALGIGDHQLNSP